MKDKVDSQLRQQLDAAVKGFDEAFNKNDSAVLAALFTEDAVLVTETGPLYGREAIEDHHAKLLHECRFDNHAGKADQYSPHTLGTALNEMWASGEWSCAIRVDSEGPPTQVNGHWSSIYVREGDGWKKRMHIYNTAPPPPE
jgi:uncharacterized protein (TIGR02246 family)